MTADDAPAHVSDPSVDEEPVARRPGDSITDFGAVAFLFAMFFLAIGLMYLIGPGHG